MFQLIGKKENSSKKVLRPENTSGVMRWFLESKEKEKDRKLYYIGRMFRYERPQHNRYRQFNQLGIEHLDANHIMDDIEMIKIGWDIVNTVKMDDYVVHINNIGDKQQRMEYSSELQKYMEQNDIYDSLSSES